MSGISLFELAADFEELFDRYDEIINAEPEDGTDPEEMRRFAEEAWFTTLSDMEDDIETKAENLAVYILHLQSDIDEMKDMEKRISDRRRAKENAVKRLKEYGIKALDAAKLKKVDRPRAYLMIRNNPESVNISDEKSFVKWALDNNRRELLKFADPTVSKSAVKPLLQNGEKVPFANLVRTRSLIIK